MEYLIHMGYSKTGSSYIQSALARTDLATFGISYPIDTDTREIARAGKITSGNYWPRAGEIERLIDQFAASKFSRLLISSESIFDVVAEPESRFIPDLKSFFPSAKIKVLCFVRDPVDHAISVYQQMVKRGGFQGSFAESFSYYHVIRICRTVFDRLQEADIAMTVLNYSRHEPRIIADTENWLGLPKGALDAPVVDRVNRSMTRAELKLQLEFNKHFGPSAAKLVSDPLCNMLPDVSSEIPEVSLQDLDRFIERMRRDLEFAKLEDFMAKEEVPQVLNAESYLARFAAAEKDRVFGFSARQIEVLVDTIVTKLPELTRLMDRNEQG